MEPKMLCGLGITHIKSVLFLLAYGCVQILKEKDIIYVCMYLDVIKLLII